MDEEIIELEEEFEKVDVEKAKASPSSSPQGERKARPAFRIVQPDTDRDGKPILREVGVAWKQTSKNGKEFYVVKIGELRLLMFKNER